MKRILLLLLLCLLPSAATHAQGTATAPIKPAVFPAAPTYLDVIAPTYTCVCGPQPTGKLTYSVDGGAPVSATIVNGAAPVSLGRFAVGPHTLVTTYSGDATYASATEAPVSFTVADLPLSLGSTQGTTFLGSGSVFNVQGVATDRLGSLYGADQALNKVYRLDLLGNVTTLPFTGISGPTGIAVDASLNVYLADTGNSRVLELTPSGVQTVLNIPGLGKPGFLAYDTAASLLYIADPANQQILSYGPQYQTVSQVVASKLTALRGIAVDPTGNVLFADRYLGFNRIPFSAGTLSYGASVPIFADVQDPGGIASDALGNVYVTDTSTNNIFRIDPLGHETSINNGGNPVIGLATDGQGRLFLGIGPRVDVITPAPAFNRAAQAPLTPVGSSSVFSLIFQVPQSQTGFSVSSTGEFSGYSAPICNAYACSLIALFRPTQPTVRSGVYTAKFATGNAATGFVYGTGYGPRQAYSPAPQTQTATTAAFTAGAALDSAGAFYAADSANNRVIKSSGGTTTVLPFSGLSGPTTVAVDAANSVYVFDVGNNRIVKLDAAGNQTVPVASSIAGPIIDIYAFAVDPAGRIYVSAEIYNPGDTQRRQTSGTYLFDAQGNTTLFTLGDAGRARAIALDPYGIVYELGYFGSVFRYDETGNFNTAFTYPGGYNGPGTLAVDSAQNVYVAQTTYGTVSLVRPIGNALVLPLANIIDPTAIALDASGNLLLADSATNLFTFVDRSQAIYAFGSTGTGNGNILPGFLSNSGNQAFSISGALPGNAVFVQAPSASSLTACTATSTLAAGAGCDLSYTFTPTASGAATYSGTVFTTAGNATANFTGTGVAVPAALLSPNPLNLSASVNSSSQAVYVTLKNTGAMALSGFHFTVSGANAADFTFGDYSCGTNTLQPGDSCQVYVMFKSATAGTFTATLTATASTAGGSSVTTSTGLHGIATQAAVVLSPTPTFDFGNVDVFVSKTLYLTVTNTGNDSVTITGATLSNFSGTGTFTTNGGCYASIAAGESCSYVYTFNSTSAGATSATLTVNTSAGNPSVQIKGNAVLPTFTPASANFGSQAPNTTSAPMVFTLTNPASDPLTITAVHFNGSSAAQFKVSASTCGNAVAPGTSCTFSVVFLTNSATTSGPIYSSTLVVETSYDLYQAALSGSQSNASAPQAALTPATANFGSVQVGQNATQTLTLSNAGNAALPISGATISGTQYTITSSTCGTSLAAGGSCSYVVTFTPTTPGSVNASLSVTDSVGTQTSALTGTATAAPTPQAALTPATANFGSVQIGQTGTQTLTLTNAGNAALPITGATIAGTQYAITSTTCGTSLAAGSNCTYLVTFTPSTAGTVNASFSVTDSVGTQTSALTGTATAAPAPQAALTPATANFGSVQIGQTATQTLTLTNAGNAALPITTNAITAGPFSLSSKTCTTSLAAGASCTFTLTYTPTTAGSQTATFSVTDSVGTQSSALTGVATAAPVPQAALTPATASFGSIAANTTSPAQTLTLTNAGTAALPITSATLTGAGFTLATNTCGTSLAAGASCTFTVTFTPTAAATYNATLTVVDSVGTQTSALSGAGTVSTPPDFAITPTPAAQSSYRGQSVAYTIALTSLTGANPFTGPVTLTATGLPVGATATFSPAIVVPGASSTLTVAVPALVGANRAVPPAGIAFAALLAGLVLLRRKRIAPMLLLALLGLASVSALSGCGTRDGFAIPTSTSTITVTGTSGTVSHSTTVTLTVK